MSAKDKEREGYPVFWKDRKLIATDLTDELKAKYTQALFSEMRNDAAFRMSRNDFNLFEKKLVINPPEWTSICDDVVIASFTRPKMWQILMRLILDLKTLEDDPVDGMSDEELIEFVDAKKNEDSDLSAAMRRIVDNSDPKATKGGHGSPRPEAESDSSPPSAENRST